jgi:hypothetical protein
MRNFLIKIGLDALTCIYIYIYIYIKILLGGVVCIGVNMCCDVDINILIIVAIFWDMAPCITRTDVSEERITSIFRTFLRNVGAYTDSTTLYPRRW